MIRVSVQSGWVMDFEWNGLMCASEAIGRGLYHACSVDVYVYVWYTTYTYTYTYIYIYVFLNYLQSYGWSDLRV